MINIYRMIFINFTASLLIIGGVLFYLYIYPKKKINLLVLLLIISILPIISIFRIGDYESGDFNIHIYRTIAFYQNLINGNFLPSWAGDLNATYGYPLFIFLNPLPYYIMSLFHILGNTFINSIKLFFAFSYILSGLFFYLWAKNETDNNIMAFVGSIIYLFSPYHLVDLHFRATVGEVSFFALLPLLLYGISKLNKKIEVHIFLFSSFTYALMIFSHQAMAVFSLAIIIPYLIYISLRSNNSIKHLLINLSIIILGFIYSIYSWIPHLTYTKFTLAYLLSAQMVSFPNLQDLLYSPWRFGFLFQGPRGELSYLIGYVQILILILGLTAIILNKVNKRLFIPILLWTSTSFFIVFMMTPLSSIIWKSFPILKTAQFSTRLMLILTFSIASLSIFVLQFFKKNSKTITFFILLAIGYTILNWGHRKLIPQITDQTLINYLPISTSQGEGFAFMGEPKWILPNTKFESKIPKEHIEILNGEGSIRQIERTDTTHTYISYSRTKIALKENTWYFPGWNLLIDGKTSIINYTYKKYPGIIIFDVPSGLHKIVLSYTDQTSLVIAKCISVISILISFIFICSYYLESIKLINFKKTLENIKHILYTAL